MLMCVRVRVFSDVVSPGLCYCLQFVAMFVALIVFVALIIDITLIVFVALIQRKRNDSDVFEMLFLLFNIFYSVSTQRSTYMLGHPTINLHSF